uniref:Uncharacterized protein n=1 Tax=Eutreptiella gymnastica TaxID=73025 RepID=A0A7S1NIJ0_9EUGL
MPPQAVTSDTPKDGSPQSGTKAQGRLHAEPPNKALKYATVLAVVLWLAVFALCLAATAIVGWTDWGNFREGLWKTCVNYITTGVECYHIATPVCEARYQMTQALSILSIVFSFAAALTGIYVLMKGISKQYGRLQVRYLFLAVSLVALVVVLATWCIWVIRNEDPKCGKPQHYGVSWVLQVVASALAFLAAVLALTVACLFWESPPRPGGVTTEEIYFPPPAVYFQAPNSQVEGTVIDVVYPPDASHTFSQPAPPMLTSAPKPYVGAGEVIDVQYRNVESPVPGGYLQAESGPVQLLTYGDAGPPAPFPSPATHGAMAY